MKAFLAFAFMMSPLLCFSQQGDKTVFEFLNVPVSARLAGLGGVNVSLADRDPSFFVANPALAGDSLSGFFSASYQFYVADIGQTFISYGQANPRFSFRVGMQHIGYGEIEGFDAGGVATGKFNAAETALVLAASHQKGNFRMGASLKPVFSNIAGLRFGALLLDIGGVFVHPRKSMTVGLVFRNMGVKMGLPSDEGRLPFDVQVGTTFKPEHMPIRFSLTAWRLTRFDVIYPDPSSVDDQPGTLAKALSHVNFGTEILLHRNVNVLAGYNVLNHRSMTLERGGAGAGVSLGLSVATSVVDVTISRSGYVAGSAGYTFSLSGNANKIIKRRKTL